jgi:hypothetical protein
MSQDDDEPTDDELAKIEDELAKLHKADSPVIDIGGAFGMYEMHSDRIRLLGSLIHSMAEFPQLEHIREVVEHELKLTLAQPEPYKLACFAASRAAYEGEAVA